MNIRPLPPEVSQFLTSQNADRRLVNHLCLVHDACCMLLEKLTKHFPGLWIDKQAIMLGAALHDAGKIPHPSEIYGVGRQHEEDGPQFLIENGFANDIARFAKTHGSWGSESDLPLADLLVALSDAIWKGSRIESLETQVAQRIATQTGLEIWDCWMKLDEFLIQIAEDADGRLAWQNSHR